MADYEPKRRSELFLNWDEKEPHGDFDKCYPESRTYRIAFSVMKNTRVGENIGNQKYSQVMDRVYELRIRAELDRRKFPFSVFVLGLLACDIKIPRKSIVRMIARDEERFGRLLEVIKQRLTCKPE